MIAGNYPSQYSRSRVRITRPNQGSQTFSLLRTGNESAGVRGLPEGMRRFAIARERARPLSWRSWAVWRVDLGPPTEAKGVAFGHRRFDGHEVPFLRDAGLHGHCPPVGRILFVFWRGRKASVGRRLGYRPRRLGRGDQSRRCGPTWFRRDPTGRPSPRTPAGPVHPEPCSGCRIRHRSACEPACAGQRRDRVWFAWGRGRFGCAASRGGNRRVPGTRRSRPRPPGACVG